jgi:ankyrin repeat protein
LAQQQLKRLEPSKSSESWQQTDDDESSQPELPQVTPTAATNSNNNEEEEGEEQIFPDTNINLTLHDLCDEARTTDDIAWRNALALLSTHPELADMSEPECLMKPLHVLVLALEPPPVWMTRALLYTHSDPTSQVDAGGRLPLHLLAATSAHVETMQLLVQEYPASIAHVDSRGFTPLQLLLKNDQVVLTLEHLRILLGQSLEKNKSGTNTTKKHLLHRRGEFLTATLEDLQALQATPEQHERLFEGFPDDVQICLKRIVQWKRRQHNKQKATDTTSSTATTEFANPACIPTVSGKLLPLHLLVKRQELLTQPNAPAIGRPIPASMSGLLRVLIAAYPEALVTRDGHGRTPLLHALLHTDALPSIDVVELLLGMRTPGYQGVPTWAEDLPMRQGERYSNPAMVPTLDSNQLALHIVAEECLDNYDLVSRVYDAYPGARLVQDARGRTPLHVALGNYRKIAVEERLLELLFVDSIARCPDDDGKIPLDLVLQQQHRLEAPCHGSKIYQDFFHASIDGPKNARQSRELLRRLRQLPPVLRKQACAAGFVQELLVEELASPILMFVILLNGCVLAALITIFRLELDEFARMQVSSTVLSNNDPTVSSSIIADWYSTAIFVLAGYHLASQVVYWIAAAYMSELYHLCLSSFWRWVDVAGAILPIATAFIISANAAEGDLIIQLGTATTGLLWLSVLGYLVHWWHGMAVFMGGATKLVGLLVWPALATGILVVAFAQMFLTLPQLECIDGNATICSIHEAYYMVYELLLGQPVMDESLSSGMIALVGVFTALLIWLMISVLCTTVAEATKLDRHQIALECYWEPRLALILSLVLGEPKPKIEEPPTCMERYCSALEIQWHVLTAAIQGTNGSKEVHWYACCLQPRAIIPLRILAVLVIPLWLILGFVTFGLLWPPQVRRWVSATRTPTKGEKEENSTEKLSGVKNEILQLKRMSYEQTNCVQREIEELKQLLMRAMQEYDSTSAT